MSEKWGRTVLIFDVYTFNMKIVLLCSSIYQSSIITYPYIAGKLNFGGGSYAPIAPDRKLALSYDRSAAATWCCSYNWIRLVLKFWRYIPSASNRHMLEIMRAIISGGRSGRPRGWEAVRIYSPIISSKIIAIIAIIPMTANIILLYRYRW